jgi:hypothetical protein
MQFHFFSLDCPFVVGSNLLRSALESFLKAASIRETEKLRTTIIRETERLRIKIPFLTARGGEKMKEQITSTIFFRRIPNGKMQCEAYPEHST